MPRQAWANSRVFFDKCFLWIQWVLATTVGWMAGAILGMYLSFLPGLFGIWDYGYIFGTYAITGLAQWLVLLQRYRQSGWWVLASVIGSSLAPYARLLGGNGAPDIVNDIMLGATIGIAQWLVLRRWYRHAGWWVLVSGVAVGVGWTASHASFEVIWKVADWLIDSRWAIVSEFGYCVYDLSFGGVAALVNGIITGFALLCLSFLERDQVRVS